MRYLPFLACLVCLVGVATLRAEGTADGEQAFRVGGRLVQVVDLAPPPSRGLATTPAVTIDTAVEAHEMAATGPSSSESLAPAHQDVLLVLVFVAIVTALMVVILDRGTDTPRITKS